MELYDPTFEEHHCSSTRKRTILVHERGLIASLPKKKKNNSKSTFDLCF